MKRAVILFISVFLCFSLYGRSLRAIRDSLEVHYGFASVQSNDDGIWFLVGVPGEAERKAEKMKKRHKHLMLSDSKPQTWIFAGRHFDASYKLGVCDITGKEIIAPGKSFVIPIINDLFTLEDGTKVDSNGAIITPVDEKSRNL